MDMLRSERVESNLGNNALMGRGSRCSERSPYELAIDIVSEYRPDGARP